MSIIKELEGLKRTVSPASKIKELREYNKGVNDAIEIVTKHTVPQPNWDRIEGLVQEYAYMQLSSYNAPLEDLVASLRTRIGYTLDANGKAVALPSSGSATTK